MGRKQRVFVKENREFHVKGRTFSNLGLELAVGKLVLRWWCRCWVGVGCRKLVLRQWCWCWRCHPSGGSLGSKVAAPIYSSRILFLSEGV